MLILQLENLRNFLLSKDSIVVLTRIAWAAIVIFAHRLSQGLQVGMWHSWLILFISYSSRLDLTAAIFEEIG